jgi:hypothetical protein
VSLLALVAAGSLGLLDSFPLSVPVSFPESFSLFSVDVDEEESPDELLVGADDFFA